MSWSVLVGRGLPSREGHGTPVPLRVRPGEVWARVDGHEVSLIRTVWPDQEWTRACAALASQPVFRARVLAGELPEATARVFTLLGLDLVPTDWGSVVATCSCDHWRGRCAHLEAVARSLATSADQDPFVLTRWAGRDERALVELVTDLTKRLSFSEGEFDDNSHTTLSPHREEVSPHVLAARAQTSEEVSPDTFWDPIPQPQIPDLPTGIGDRIRAAAPAHIADELPGTTSLSTREENP